MAKIEISTIISTIMKIQMQGSSFFKEEAKGKSF